MTGSALTLLLSRMLRSLWFTPALYAAIAVAVLAAAPLVAPFLPDGLMKLIGLTGVYDLLNALASTLLTVAVFSLGIMAASLRAVSSAATPRVRPLLVEDSIARNAISTFIGGFVYAVVGIVGLSTGYYSDAAKVLLFFVTCLLILALIVALVRWIGRLSRLGDVTEGIDLVEEVTRKSLRALAADPCFGGVVSDLSPPRDGIPVLAPEPGYVQAINVDHLGALADELSVDLHLTARPGAFVTSSRPLVIASRPLADEERRRLCGTFVIGRQRSFEADPRFGLTVLSEIASRALSSGINDPGTAIDVITTGFRLLSEWSDAAKRAQPGIRHPRLHVEPIPAEELLQDVYRWIARDGAKTVEVQVWLQKCFLALATQDPERFGPAARRLSREALKRAEAEMSLPEDLDLLRVFAD